jgi:hypothetical protein|tara:strand:+ start:774 stop:1046 length:273 start_codon:yes stop_codon:yes gene_type:complete
MKLFILIILFIGIILVIQGIYDEKIQDLQQKTKVEYRFIPRSYYDEQIFSNQFSSKFSNIFDEEKDEWSANKRNFKEYTDDELKNKEINK